MASPPLSQSSVCRTAVGGAWGRCCGQLAGKGLDFCRLTGLSWGERADLATLVSAARTIPLIFGLCTGFFRVPVTWHGAMYMEKAVYV